MLDYQENPSDSLTSVAPTTSTLFHYTSQQGLLGIVDRKALWLSSIRHLNDATEFGYAVGLVRAKLLRKLKSECGPSNDYYGYILDGLEVTEYLTLFVGSFSEHADLLSQWRAYTPSGVGFSVGFEFDHLRAMSKEQGLRIVKCVYERAEQDAILERLINRAGALVDGSTSYEAAGTFLEDFYKVAPALKDPSFLEEREWRVVSSILLPKATPPKFRPGKSMLIPYQEFKLAKDGQRMPISRIIVGPTPHKELSISSLGYLLASSKDVDPDTCTLAPSRVPYRSW